MTRQTAPYARSHPLDTTVAIFFLTMISPSAARSGQGDIILQPMFVDSEHNFGVTFSDGKKPSMSTEIYFEEGLTRRFTYIGGIDTQANHDLGVVYIFKYQGLEMGGASLGYNHVGNGAFFHPTILIPASLVPDMQWRRAGTYDYAGVIVQSAPYIADRGDIDSIALCQDFTGYVLNHYAGKMSVTYLPGNVLFPGSAEHLFQTGAVDYTMTGFWGPVSSDPDPSSAYFTITPAEGPMEVSFAMEGYTTTTLRLTVEAGHSYGYSNIYASTTGKTATQYLQEIGYEPSPPPVWVKKMALEEKLTGKTKWLYPPLDRHADANGDGIYDAADLAAVYMAAKKE